MRDLVNNVDGQSSIDPSIPTSTQTGVGIDLQGFGAAMLLFIIGTLTDGVHTLTMEESDVLGSGYTTVAAADMDGTLGVAVSDTNQRVGYKGTKRYIRAINTITGSPATGCEIAAVVCRGIPNSGPVA